MARLGPRLPRALAFIAVLLGAGMALPGSAAAWWQEDWPYRQEITLDTTTNGVEIRDPIGRAPLLVRLHSGNFTFEDAAPGGADLRFVAADDKTALTYHVETFDPQLGVATIWVDVPEFPAGATQKIWMYYGNKEAPVAIDVPATFDADYIAVYHMDAATGSPAQDKTAYGNNAQTAPQSYDDAAVIGKGARFTGAAPMMTPASPALAIAAGAPFTFSAWVRMDEVQADATLFANGPLRIGAANGAPYVLVGGERVAGTTPLATGQWTHVALVSDGRSMTLLINGRASGTLAAATPAMSGPFALGGDLPGGEGAGFIGGMDEVRLSKVARPMGLIAADAASQGAESRMIAFGPNEKQGGHGGHFGVIMGNLTIDAWVVIWICVLLAVISLAVMYLRMTYTASVQSANDRFLRDFRANASEPLALARDDAAVGRHGKSSIFRVYKAGADEILQRIPKSGPLILRPEAVQVIRSLMNTQLVREGQRQTAGIVWLTIAISGGPFLGLLGTVVGVMITFAAIAEAGDVNVNAIAPGISAALAATVAGLAVAIPALFGYNYILLRNKAVSNNMAVFEDEFVTRVSERYSRPELALAAE